MSPYHQNERDEIAAVGTAGLLFLVAFLIIGITLIVYIAS